MNKQQTLDAAKTAVADRGVNYGKPEDNFIRIARLWTTHLLNRYGAMVPLDDADVAMMMIFVKVARLENQPDHPDSWIDTAGYAACGADLYDKPVEHRQDIHDFAGRDDPDHFVVDIPV